MSRMKRLYLIAPFLILSFAPVCFAQQDRITEIRTFLEQKSNFSSEQIQEVLSLLTIASEEGLPVEFLVNRIKEGIARKADFQLIIRVMNHKIEKLRLADMLIRHCLDTGMTVKRLDYCRQVLGKLLERNLSPDDFKGLSDLAVLRKMALEELIDTSAVLVKIAEQGVPVEYIKEVVTLALTKKIDIRRIEKIANLFLEAKMMHLSPVEARDIILEGISQGLSVGRIRENIKDVSVSEESRERARREEKGEVTEELRQRGQEGREERERKGERERR